MEDKKQDQPQRADQLEQQGFEEYTSPSPNEIRPQEYNQPTQPGSINQVEEDDNSLSRNQATKADGQNQGIGQGQNQGNEDGGRQQSGGGMGYGQGQNTGATGYGDQSGYRDKGQGTDSNNRDLGRGPQAGTQNPHSETAQENYGDNEATNTSNMDDDANETKSPLRPTDQNKSPEDFQQNSGYYQQDMVEDKKDSDAISQ